VNVGEETRDAEMRRLCCEMGSEELKRVESMGGAAM